MTVGANGNRALGYCRISTEHQEAGISVETQKEHIRACCEANGLTLIREIVVDIESGTKRRRDGLDKIIIPMAQARQYDRLVVYDQDRWFRNEYGRLKLENEVFKPNGIDLLVTNEGTFSRQEERDLFRSMKGSISEYQARQTRSKIIDAMQYKAQRMEYMGGQVRYGYQVKVVEHRTNARGKRKPISTLVPDESESKIVRFIFELYGLGASTLFPLPEGYGQLAEFGSSVITDILNALGLRQRNGKPWSTFSVKKLLRDEHDYLLGTFSYNKGYGRPEDRELRGASHRPRDEWIVRLDAYEPVVSCDLHELCRHKLEGNSAKHGGGRAKRSQYLGSGIFVDACCGGRLLGRTRSASGRHPEALRYMCENRYNKRGCRLPMVSAGCLDRSLETVLEAFFSSAENREAVLAAAASGLSEKPHDRLTIEAELKRASRELENLKQNLRREPDIATLIRDDLVSLNAQVERLKATQRRMMRENGPGQEGQLEALRGLLDSFLTVWRDVPTREKNRLLRLLIDRAEVDVRNKTVKYRLAIPLGTADGQGGEAESPRGCTRTVAEVLRWPNAPQHVPVFSWEYTHSWAR